jgi:hypothetical protein
MMIVMVGLDFWTLVSYQSHSFLFSLCFGGVEKKKWSYEKKKKAKCHCINGCYFLGIEL